MARDAAADQAPAAAQDATTKAANEMWGGRFAAGPAAVMAKINQSIGFDKRLYAQDIRASQAHAAMLVAQGIIGAEDGAAIGRGLDQVLAEIESRRFPVRRRRWKTST